ncbi:DNA-binding transcriptional LysR family regulator [Paenibacillus taihuensis]|uniref:DNA-binding transcriptional LysR family regulator n=1 Tax=Paenibacillus taihuensis TaxID=1156355 RepID=A0A3D9RUU7_9BACL|nr:LysR family transcriptional regulator [Paenibacillus taihuensis]REE81521.1 DNA-binding transcriptional LysR family regulator [Paenibacillus taihuensis]
MDSSQLEAFLAVCQIQNFTKAAEHLHISQSAVTARIKGLETEVGKTLLLRDNRNVKLTQAGIAFLPYAQRMIRLYAESKLTLSEQFEHQLILSGPGSVWHYRYLPNILAFRQNHPEVAVKFLSNIDPGYMIRDLLLDGVVHVSVRFDPPDHPKVSQLLLFEDPLILVSAVDREAPVHKADLRSASYCHIEWGYPFPDWFAGVAGAGFVPALHTDHSAIMLTMLLQGAGFGFMPLSIAQPYLDAQRLFRLPCAFETPTITAYAQYLAEQREHRTVQLGLELLGSHRV